MAKKATDFHIDKYPDEYLQCRDLRHHWNVVGFFRDGKYVRREVQCGVCDTRRMDTWTAGGQRVRAIYTYRPDGYLVTGGLKNLEVRKEQLARVNVYANEEDMMAALFGGKK